MSMYYVVTGAAGFIGSQPGRGAQPPRRHRHHRRRQPAAGGQVPQPRRLRDRGLPRPGATSSSVCDERCDGSVEAVLHQGACSDTMETDGRYMMENNYALLASALLDWCQEDEVPLHLRLVGRGLRRGPGVPRGAPLRGAAQRLRLLEVPVRPVRARGCCDGRTAQIAGLRYFNVYGPNEAHKGRMASVALPRLQAVQRRGQGASCSSASDGYGDGEQRRDFVHVDDVVAVNLWLLERPRRLGHLQLRHRPRAELQRRRRGGDQRACSGTQPHAAASSRQGADRVHAVPAGRSRASTRATPRRTCRACAPRAIRASS